MIRRFIPVVHTRITPIRELISRRAQQRTTIERCRKTRDDRVTCRVGARSEGTSAAAEDVLCRRWAEVTGLAQLQLVALHATSNIAGCGLCVDRERFAAELIPHSLRVTVPIVAPRVGIPDEEIVGAQDAERTAVSFVDELVPGATIALGLSTELIGDGLEAVGTHAWDCLSVALCVGETEGDGDRDEIDVGNVGEELGVVEGKLAERPIDVEVGIAWVGYARFDDRRPWVDKEGQLGIDAEPYTTACNLWYIDVDGIARRTERNSNIGL